MRHEHEDTEALSKRIKKELDRKAMQISNDEQINDNKKGQGENTPAIRSRDGQCKGREVICMGGEVENRPRTAKVDGSPPHNNNHDIYSTPPGERQLLHWIVNTHYLATPLAR